MARFSYTTEEWYLPQNFIAYYAGKSGNANDSTLPVYIPVLMPKVSQGAKSELTKALSSACFCNDSKCKPKISSSIKVRNYINVKRYPNQYFGSSALTGSMTLTVNGSTGQGNLVRTGNTKSDTKIGYFTYGAEIDIEAKEGSIDNMWITNSKDNSTSKATSESITFNMHTYYDEE